MAFGKKGGGITTGAALLLFVMAGLAGTAASFYAIVVAYLAGSSAQASIDGCPAADPMSLARASMEELGTQVAAANGSTVINVDESKVNVTDAKPSLDAEGGVA